MDQSVVQHLQQVVCFSLEDISLWGARRKLRPEDLRLSSGDELPPKDLASLGSKKIFNPKILSKFDALKKQAHTACAKVGVRFMGGYAVPETAADDLAAELDKIGVEFDQVKKLFVDTYTAELEVWIAAHPGWEQVIRNSAISVAEVEGKIRYGWVPAKITTPDEKNPNSRLHQKMVKEAGGLAGSLFRECAETATKIGDSLLGKLRVNRRALSPIRKIRSKLSGLSFLDKRVTPLITLIDETLGKMPGDAPIEGLELTALNGLVMTLSTVDRMKEYGQAVLDGNQVAPSVGVVIPKANRQPTASAEIATPAAVAETPNLFADTPILFAEDPQFAVSGELNESASSNDKQDGVADNLFANIAPAVDDLPMVRVVVEEVRTPDLAVPVVPAAVVEAAIPRRPMRRVTF